MTKSRLILPSLALLGCLATSQDVSAGWGCIASSGLCVTGGATGQEWCFSFSGAYGSGNPTDNPSFTEVFHGFCYFA